MIQLKIIFIVLFALIQTAYGKTYYSEDIQSAVIYFMPDETTVNAVYCRGIDESTARQIARNVRASEGYDQTVCEKILNEGISQASVESKIQEIKQQLIEIGSFEDFVSQSIEDSKAVVEQMDAKKLFSNLVTKTKSPVIELVDLEELNAEIKALMMFFQ